MSTDIVDIDGVALPPGDKEAAAIRADYEIFAKGAEAFLRMGLRLIDVKARLPHGQFMDWCEEHLSGLSNRWLQKSKQTASSALKVAGVQMRTAVRIWESPELPPELAELIEGRSARQLIADIREFRSDELEEKNKRLCEERWARDPEARDEWEPQVLAGEVTYTYAMRGMTGQELKGAARPRVNYDALISRNLTSLPKCWEKWGELSDEAKTEALNKLPESVSTAPLVVLQTLQRAIQTKLSERFPEGGSA